MTLEERFIKYIAFDTMSKDGVSSYPSTPSQLIFADMLVNDLKEIGVNDAYKDEFGLVYGHVNIGKEKTICLIAHMDTAPALVGGIKNPKKVKNYAGGNIVLNDKYVLNPEVFPVMNSLVGDDLLVTDGEHLLGGDDKAGVAIIFEFAKYYIEHQNEFTFNLSICFTPDEEVGGGWLHFDVKKAKADFGFTLDGESIYEANHENFNAASAVIEIKGVGVHPGSAYEVMENAASIASEYQELMPKDEVPEKTQMYEGFIHLSSITGDVESAKLEYIIRDHNKDLLEKKKVLMMEASKKVQNAHPKANVQIEIKDDYRNMADYFIEHPEAIEMINKAYLASKTKLSYEPIRGGTDGAMITYMGLPCPNLGTGDFNPHGRYEFVSLTEMNKMVEILKNLLKE
jgi:tripeptide aminopeptidase